MKNILYVSLIAFAALSITGCRNEGDVRFDDLKKYLGTQTEVGIYRDGTPLAIFDEQTEQLYFNRNSKLCRIQSDDGAKYIDLTLSAAPVAGKTVDLTLDAEGYEALTDEVFTSLTVVELTDGLCRLAGSASNSYTGFVIVWAE